MSGTLPRQPIRLGLNVDHAATLRNARGGTHPDPVAFAEATLAAGADGITAHLREDRRHIRDADMEALAELCARANAPLNFEMAATAEMIALARHLRPHAVCLVPEKREERTTEGGLDVANATGTIAAAIAALTPCGARISLFIEPEDHQILAAHAAGAAAVEFHTGIFCDALRAGHTTIVAREFDRHRRAFSRAAALGLEIHAGHGLDYASAKQLARLPEVVEFNIGHFLLGEALFIGIGASIGQMRAAMDEGRRLASDGRFSNAGSAE